MSIHTNYADASGRQFLAVNETQVEIPDRANAFAQWPDGTNIPRSGSIAGIDWTTALGPDPDRPDAVYYDGLTLRNANGKSLAEAANDLQARIDAVLRGRGINDDADAT